MVRESVAIIKKEHRVKSSDTLVMEDLSQFARASSDDFTINYEKGKEIVLNHILPNGPLKRVGKEIAVGILALAISVSASLLLSGIIIAAPVAGVMIGLVLIFSMALILLAALMALTYACLKFTLGVAKAITEGFVIEAKGNFVQKDLEYSKFFLLYWIQEKYPEINKETLSKALDYELAKALRLPFKIE